MGGLEGSYFFKGIFPKVNVIAQLEFELQFSSPALQPLHDGDTPRTLEDSYHKPLYNLVYAIRREYGQG